MKINYRKSAFVLLFPLLASLVAGCAWQKTLKDRVAVYGHRNWIVVADSAYPKQSNPGIETVQTGSSQIEVLKAVLKEIEGTPHVQAVVMLDSELDSVTEADAPGVEAYRAELKKLLAHKQVKVMQHEKIIRELDEGAKLFNVLLLKSDMTIPYTSVFIQLDCGYWNAEKEARLRKALKK